MKRLFFLAVAVLLSVTGCGKGPERAKALAAAEKAFSDLSAKEGTRKAFLAFLSEDALTFRPEPVLGKPLYEQRQDRRDVRLSWTPVLAEVASEDDMGFTTGPYFLTVDEVIRKVYGHGQYVTVWKKQPGGSWRVALDLGIQHDSLATPVPALQLRYPRRSAPSPAQQAAELNGLRSADSVLMALAAEKGWHLALQAYACDDLRLLREGKAPVTGKSEAVAALADTSLTAGFITGAAISAAADLGYSYGEMKRLTQGTPQRHSYVRLWRRDQDDAWKVALEIALPFAN